MEPWTGPKEEKWAPYFDEVFQELYKAVNSFPRFNTLHEGYAVILEEMDELWEEVKGHNRVEARKEVVQVAAMALRFLIEFDKMKAN